MTLNALMDHYQNFRKRYEAGEDEGLSELGGSQSPKIMVLTCCDSRISLHTLFGKKPGEIFVVRNVANVVPHHESGEGSHGVSAALEFAVKFLKVEHLIVMGHSNCGGIKTLYQQTGPTEYLHKWVKHIQEAYERLIEGPTEPSEEPVLLKKLEQENICLGLERLMEFDWIREAVERGTLQTHGWYFDISTGKVLALKENKEFVAL